MKVLKTLQQGKKFIKGITRTPDKNFPSRLKVSFSWLFESDYKVIFLDKEYGYSMVTSGTKDYL